MRISFYDLGDLKEKEKYGLFKIYSYDGSPILDENEKIIDKIRTICYIGCRIGPVKHALTILDSGDGILYRTNKRLIYIRTPQPFWAFSATGGMPGSLAYVGWARELRDRGYRECFDIPMDEIIGFRKIRQGAEVFILFDDRLYRLGLHAYWKFFSFTHLVKLKNINTPQALFKFVKSIPKIPEVDYKKLKKEYAHLDEPTT
jgi:hypothetical protein